MSLFMGQSGQFTTAGLIVTNDLRLMAYSMPIRGVPKMPDRPFEDGQLWPRTKWMGPDMGNGLLSETQNTTNRYEAPPPEGGGQQRKKIVGTTRDSTGTELGSCVVQGFVTSTGTFVGQCTSDAAGYYELPTQYASTQHYLVAYKPGSPDVAGTTVNTIVPV